MKLVISASTASASVSPGNRFDFNTHREFRACYEQVVGSPEVKTIKIDLGQVSFLDSSALGMLLLLKDKATATGQTVEIINAKGEVLQILDVANFGKLFRIN